MRLEDREDLFEGEGGGVAGEVEVAVGVDGFDGGEEAAAIGGAPGPLAAAAP